MTLSESRARKVTSLNLESRISNLESTSNFHLADDIAHVLSEAARNTFGVKSKYRSMRGKQKTHKPWFGPECKSMRKSYNKAWKRYKQNKTFYNKLYYRNTAKQYKKCMNKYVKLHKEKTSVLLRDSMKHSPKAFWKILNPKRGDNSDHCPDIDCFYDYFKNINEKDKHDNSSVNSEGELPLLDTTCLNKTFTIEEVASAVSKLKRDKAAGMDLVENDYLIDTFDMLGPLYTSYFNLVFSSGIIPDAWLSGAIRPIYKKKGDVNDPNFYRPITILSCFGKLFTCVLNQRLDYFLKYNNLLTSAQAGFRKGFSTSDNVFILHMITQLLNCSKKNCTAFL